MKKRSGNNKYAAYGSKDLFEAIQKIAHYGVIDSKTGAVKGTEKIRGFVAKIHDAYEESDLAGTVDVQEYVDFDYDPDVTDKIGYHEGVYLSPLKTAAGLTVVPKLYSDVVIEYDPATQNEYVVQSAHSDEIKIDSGGTLTLGVVERKPYNIDDDKDIEDLVITGNMAVTSYTKDGITSTVVSSEQGKKGATLELKGDGVHICGDVSEQPAVLGDDLKGALGHICGVLDKITIALADMTCGAYKNVKAAGYPEIVSAISEAKTSINSILTDRVFIGK